MELVKLELKFALELMFCSGEILFGLQKIKGNPFSRSRLFRSNENKRESVSARVPQKAQVIHFTATPKL